MAAKSQTSYPPRWMTIKQVQQYCPLGESLVLRLLKSGRLRGGQMVDDRRNTRFIDRLSLDAYFDSMCETSNVEKEALAISEELGL